MSAFKWTPKRQKAALALAQGYTEQESAEQARVTDRTIRRWKRDLDFSVEVDRLSLMIGLSSRAERLRIAMQVARQKAREDGGFDTSKDLLDWLKFAQSETDGAKLDLAIIFDAMEAEESNRESDDAGEQE